MAVLLDYLWQSSFCLLFFFGIYFVFLRNEKALKFSRFFILAAPILALTFPLIKIPVNFYIPDLSLEQSKFFRAWSLVDMPEDFVATVGLPEVTVKSTKLPALWEIKDYLLFFYLLISILLALRFLYQLIQIRNIIHKGWRQTYYDLKNNCYLIPTFGLHPIFSFFNKIFWDETQELSDDEKTQIFQHELEHVRQRHSWDIIFYEILAVLFWVNPGVHLMRRELLDVHEFLADDHVLYKTTNKEQYFHLLIKMTFNGIDLSIPNYFIRSMTLKRIMMMKKTKNTNWFKAGMVLPLSGMLLALVSMKTDYSSGIDSFPPLEIISKELTDPKGKLNFNASLINNRDLSHQELNGLPESDQIVVQLGDFQIEITNLNSKEAFLEVIQLITDLNKQLPGKTSLSTGLFELTNHQEIQSLPKSSWIDQHLNSPVSSQKFAYSRQEGSGEIPFISDQQVNIFNSIENQKGDPVQNSHTAPVNSSYSSENEVNSASHHFKFQGTSAGTPKGSSSHPSPSYNVIPKVLPSPEFLEYTRRQLNNSAPGREWNYYGYLYCQLTLNENGKIIHVEVIKGDHSKASHQDLINILKRAPNWQVEGPDSHFTIRFPILVKGGIFYFPQEYHPSFQNVRSESLNGYVPAN
jgi:hypothetical protein